MHELLSHQELSFKALVSATMGTTYRISSDWSLISRFEADGELFQQAFVLDDWLSLNISPEEALTFKTALEIALEQKSILEINYHPVLTNGAFGLIQFRAVPVLDQSNRIVEWVAVGNDITKQQLLEKELTSQRKRYEAVTAGTPDLVYVFDLDYTFNYANEALLNMWGKSAEEAIGKGLLENGYEPWHAQMHEREIDHIVATGKQVRGEVCFPHATQGERVYDYILTPVFDEQRHVVAVSGITRDVTDYRRQQSKKAELTEQMATVNEELAASNEELKAINDEVQSSRELIAQANGNLELILNMLPASVVVIRGHDLVVEMINDSNLKYWNREKKDVIGRRFLDILPDLANQPFASQLRHVIDTGEVIEVIESPVIFQMEDGNLRETFVDYVYQPLSDLSGKRNGVLVMSFEITDRVNSRRLLEGYAADLIEANEKLKFTNEELFQSEQRFRHLIQNAPVAIGVLHGRELIVESANEKLLQVWGKSSKIIGLCLNEALPELLGQSFLDILDHVFTTGEPFIANEILAKLEHNSVLQEFFFNLVYQPLLDTNGVTVDILVVAVDITQQVNARLQVERSERHFKRLADLVPAKITNALPTGEVTFFNQHWLDFSGMDLQALMEFGYQHLIHPEEITAFEYGFSNAAIEKIPFVSELRFKNKDGKYIWHLHIASPVLNEIDEITMWVGSTTDIQQIKEEEQRKTDFVSMLSHELKTPVTSIKGYVQLLLRQLGREEESDFSKKMSVSLTRIDSILKHLTGLIGDMLDLSRVDVAKLDLHLEPVTVNELVTEVVSDFRLSHPKHLFNLKITDDIALIADRSRISQVLINLISNAIKYAPDATIVNVDLHTFEDELLISVQDYGIGIEEAEQKKVFERFYRVEGANEKTFSGFGIGLFLVNSIVKQHGGYIDLFSEKGNGSVFTVHLPLFPIPE